MTEELLAEQIRQAVPTMQPGVPERIAKALLPWVTYQVTHQAHTKAATVLRGMAEESALWSSIALHDYADQIEKGKR